MNIGDYMKKNKVFLLVALAVIVILYGISLRLIPKQKAIIMPRMTAKVATSSATLTPTATPSASEVSKYTYITPTATPTAVQRFKSYPTNAMPIATPTEAVK